MLNHLFFVTTEFFSPDQPKTGGLGHYMYKTALMLTQCGIKVTVIHAGSSVAHTRLNDTLELYGIAPVVYKPLWYEYLLHYVHKYTTGMSYLHYCKLKFNAKQVQQFVNQLALEKKPALIQYSNLAGIAYFADATVPSVIRISSHTGLYNKLGKGYYGLAPEKVKAQEKIETESYQKVNAILSPSKAMLDAIPVQKNQLRRVIESPVFDYRLAELPSAKHDGKPFLFFYGSVDYRKGADLLLKAFDELQRDDIELVFAGRCSEDSPENKKIASAIQNNSIRGVRYAGTLNKAQLQVMLQNATAVVLPSRVDNFPNTLTEALQCGKLVIGPGNWGFEQVLQDGVNGLLFETGNAASLLEAIKKALQLSPHEKEKIEQAALVAASELHPDPVTERMLVFYAGVLKHHKSLCAE